MSGARLVTPHHSLKGRKRKPRLMDSLEMTYEQKVAMSDIALKVFADCSNVGHGFGDAILAVYLSGLHHGHCATADIEINPVLKQEGKA